ncbi:cytochrome P450 [Pestalotiopsis sp. NC0098]|nr:cytochrome P450 [Pestalotiopsis sp. NC0098]
MASHFQQYGGFTSLLYGLLTCVLLLLGYQLLLHPLQRYPGPLLAKFTNVYSAFFAYKRTLHLEVWRYHQSYGPVVRLGPDRLVFDSPQALKDIYRNDRVTKPPIYLATQAKSGTYSLWNALDRGLHSRKRRQVGRATTEASMREFEPTMLEQIDVFIDRLSKTLNEPVNMKERCSYMSFDIIGLLSFGYVLNLQSDTKNQFLAEQLSRGNHRMNIFMQIPLIPRFKLQRYFNLFFKQEREKTANLMGTMIRTRMAQDAGAKRDLYSFLADSLNAQDDESLRMGDLWMEAFFFIIAGGDTTSTAMSATLFYLARNPSCYQELAREIRSEFNNADEICGTAVSNCHYLRACIDEALRMSPPAPGTLWRHLAPEEEAAGPFIVDGHVIPNGTKVGVNIYSLHHNEEYFPQPFVYNPDRWLDLEDPRSTKETPGASREAFAPFLVGARGCAGKSMAYLELSLALAKVIWHFDFKAAPGDLGNIGIGDHGEFRLYDIFTSTHDGPYLVFEKRE